MINVRFPVVKTTLITKFFVPKNNIEKYTTVLLKELKEGVLPNENAEINKQVLSQIRTDFKDLVMRENSALKGKLIIKLSEKNAFNIAQQHYDAMSKPENLSKVVNLYEITEKAYKHFCLSEKYMEEAEQILSSAEKSGKQLTGKQKKLYNELLYKADKSENERNKCLLDKANQQLANIKAAKEYGFYDSYDFVYGA